MSLSIEDLRTIISSGKKTRFGKAMGDILAEKQNNLPDFYDFYGKLIREDTNFTLSKCYIYFRKWAQRILSIDQLMEMDKILMENYALSKHEPLEFCFSGAIGRSAPTMGISVTGVVYITKLRVIGIGAVFKRRIEVISAIVGAIAPPAPGALDKTFRNRMQETLGDDFSESEFTKFDHIFPINKPYDLRRKKKFVGYTTDIEFEKKGKTKKKKLIILLMPTKMRNEDKNAFATRKEELLNKIESFLLSYQ